MCARAGGPSVVQLAREYRCDDAEEMHRVTAAKPSALCDLKDLFPSSSPITPPMAVT